MQSNQNALVSDFNIIDADVWETLYELIKTETKLPKLILYINEMSIKYNIDKKI